MNLAILGINLKETFSWQSGSSHVIWHFIIVGTLSLCIERVWHWFKEKPTEIKRQIIFWGTTIVCSFGIVCFVGQIVWALAGHIADEVAKSSRGHPKLFCETRAINLGDFDPTNHCIIPTIRVYNSGTPTVLLEWHLFASGPNRASFEVHISPVQHDLILTDTSGGQTHFYESNCIALKALTDPIGLGAMKEGHVVFLVPEASHEWLADRDTKLELRFSDIEGNVTTQAFNGVFTKAPIR